MNAIETSHSAYRKTNKKTLKKNKSMKISVELTLLPLNDNYKIAIKNFIIKLRSLGFKVMENPMSTQVYGEYDALMSALQKAVKESFENELSVVVNMKIIKGDRSAYVPNF